MKNLQGVICARNWNFTIRTNAQHRIWPREWDVQTLLRFWGTNELRNLGKTTRPGNSQQQQQQQQRIRSYLPNPSARAGYDTMSIFKRSLTGLNSEFSFSQTSCLTKAEEPSLPYYLPTAGGRIIGFIPFPRVLVLCEMQSVLSRNWTRIAVFIPCDDNHYTTGTSYNKELDELWTLLFWLTSE